MTVHVSVHSISALLLLSGSLLGLPADALAQSVVAPQKTAPTLAERLDRLATEFDRNRIDLHLPGAVLAIVRGEEVIFARGFGVADIERKTPVTPDTRFFIGSSTKAFTATLVGMLVDERRMRWDEPVDTYPTGLASPAWHFLKSTEDCSKRPAAWRDRSAPCSAPRA